jgi:AraC-like DNA-binding protein
MFVAGPATRSLPRPLTPPFAVVGARFHPGIGPALLGLPAHELVDLYVPLPSLDSGPARSLVAGLDGAENAGQAVSAMAEGISRLGGDRGSIDPLVRAAAQGLDRPGAVVGTLAERLGISERQLQRRFRDAVGYGPKTLQRILRFQRALGELRGGRDRSDGLAQVAAATGYADQAHLTRESQRLAGFSPKRLELDGAWARQSSRRPFARSTKRAHTVR